MSFRKRYAFPVENLQKLVATTFEVDERVKACALLLEGTELLTKLNTTDMHGGLRSQLSYKVFSEFIQMCTKDGIG